MDRQVLKYRIIGALVLLSIGVIFLPMILDGRNPVLEEESPLPPRPATATFGSYEPRQVEWAEDTRHDPWADVDRVEETPPDPEKPEVPDSELPKRPALQENGLPEAWAVQLATFSRAENATALSTRLRKAGYHAYEQEVQTAGGTMVRVFVGPEMVATHARELRDKLGKEFKLKGIVVRFRP